MAFRIDPSKITDYLFSDRTRKSAAKNRWFRRVGFHPDSWQVLEQALLQHPVMARLEKTESSPFGQKLTFLCTGLVAPTGKTYCIRSVWQEREGDPWFVTAYPQDLPDTAVLR